MITDTTPLEKETETETEIENNIETMDCAICLENLAYNHRKIFVTSCGHSFHKMCFDKLPTITTYKQVEIREQNDNCEKQYIYLYKQSVNCPCCRNMLPPSNQHIRDFLQQRILVEKRIIAEKKYQRDQSVNDSKLYISLLQKKIKQEKENIQQIKMKYNKNYASFRDVLSSIREKIKCLQ